MEGMLPAWLSRLSVDCGLSSHGAMLLERALEGVGLGRMVPGETSSVGCCSSLCAIYS